MQRVERSPDGLRARERPEIISLAIARAAMFCDLWRGVIARKQDVGKRLVVAHQHVEARLQLLDEIGLEQQRFRLGLRRHEDHRRGQRDHARDAIGVPLATHVGGDTLLHALRLADIQNLAVDRDHAIDAGPERRMLPVCADDLDAARQRPRRGLGRKVEIDSRQALFAVVGNVDVLGRRVDGVLGHGLRFRLMRPGCNRPPRRVYTATADTSRP